MKKVLTGLVSAVALFGLAACGEGDDTTTQSVDPGATDTAPMEEPATGADDTATQGMEPDTGGAGTTPAQ